MPAIPGAAPRLDAADIRYGETPLFTATLNTKSDQMPLKRTPAILTLGAEGAGCGSVLTDRAVRARLAVRSAIRHVLFPRGGPEAKGRRLAGLSRTKGER